ncbi:hypothetical protein BDR05DRAFT_448042 [Suillus weaverae]|nr:hypothetical protein BDR05DRAFT_448042 [Suillus weaverae]
MRSALQVCTPFAVMCKLICISSTVLTAIIGGPFRKSVMRKLQLHDRIGRFDGTMLACCQSSSNLARQKNDSGMARSTYTAV